MKTLRVACLTAALLGSTAGAFAAPLAVSNGAHASTYVRDCRTPAERSAGILTPSMCNDHIVNFEGTLMDMRYDSNYGGLTAATTTLAPLGAGTMGSVDASGTPGTLILRQASYARSSYTRVSSQVEAMQSFSWDGTGSSHRAIAGHLNFSATHLTDSAGFRDALTTPASHVMASINVFSLTDSSFDVDSSIDYRPSFETQAVGLASYASEASSFFQEVGGTGVDWLLEFDLVAGRTYYINAWFGIWAKYGAHVDATHTMTATLGQLDRNGGFEQSIAGLQLAAASDQGDHHGNTVPEPSGSALLLLALAGLFALRRQRH